MALPFPESTSKTLDPTEAQPLGSLTPAQPSLGRSIVAFGFLMVAEFFYAWAWYTVDVLRPYIRESLGLTLTEVGSGYSAQAAGALIGAIVVGQLADRLGRRNMLVTVMVGYGLSLLAGTAVTSYLQYLTERFVLGLFLGGIFPIVVGIYVGLFRSNVRGRLASLINGIASAAIVVLGLASSAVASQDWRLLLWIGGIPPILLAGFAYMIIPKGVDSSTPSADKSRLPLLELFTPAVRRQTVMLAALMGLNFFAYQAFSGWLTTYLRDSLHLTPKPVGQLVAWVSGANMVGGFCWGWAGDRLGRRFNAFGFFGAAAAISVYLLLPANVLLLSVVGALYGFMLSSSVVWGPWLTELYPPHLKSTAASIFNWGRIVSIFAPLVTGALAASFGLHATMGVSAITFVIAGLMWLALPETHERPLLRGRQLAVAVLP